MSEEKKELTPKAQTHERGSIPAVRDDIAYVAPMFVFLAFVWAGGNWKQLYPHFYLARAVIVAILLAIFWRSYTKIRWNGWWLGAILGVISVFQWIAMQLLLQKI